MDPSLWKPLSDPMLELWQRHLLKIVQQHHESIYDEMLTALLRARAERALEHRAERFDRICMSDVHGRSEPAILLA